MRHIKPCQVSGSTLPSSRQQTSCSTNAPFEKHWDNISCSVMRHCSGKGKRMGESLELEMQTLGPHSRASESNFAFSQEPQVTVLNIKLRSPASNDLQKCTQLWAPIIPNLESLTVYDSIFSKQSQTDHTSVTHTVLNANFIL